MLSLRKRAVFVAAFLCLALVTPIAFGQWNWAKPADWQASACRVTCPLGNGTAAAGSGALIDVEGVKMVLTCAHVVEAKNGVARFRDGTEVTGKWHTPKQGEFDTGFDCAVLALDDATQVDHIPGLQLAEDDAKRGQRIEIMGFGGGKALFRPYYGYITDDRYGAPRPDPNGGYYWEGQHADCPVVHGDSGSVVVDEQGKVVAVQNVGDGDGFAGKTAEGTGYYATCGICPLRPITSFVRRVRWKMTYGFDKQYPGTQCGPNGCPQPGYSQPSPRGGGGLYPPQDQYPSQPSQRPQNPQRPAPEGQSQSPYQAPAPAPQAAPMPSQLDYDKLAEAILKQGGDKLRGPAGPAGKDGVAGKDGRDGAAGKDADPSAIAQAVSNALPIDEIAAKAASLIDLDLIASKVVINPPSNAPVRRHAVLITERSKSYWDSLSAIVVKAQTRYAGIKVADKPESEIGPMPFLAVYQNGVPVEQYRGIDEVSRKLTEVSEGGAL